MGLRTFTFAGTCSSDFDMFITEAATYNVPERAVEMFEIPGRNGAFAMDQGRYSNVEVTYHVCVSKDSNADFQTELSDVRNWLASNNGYHRLEDDYNSGIYRMAIFKGGLETDETFVNGAEFEIVFDCMPQRWLTSGESETAVTSGGTITNPTPFDSLPLLAVKGYGNLTFNGFSIDVENAVLGNLYFADGEQFAVPHTFTFDTTLLNNGDSITVNGQFDFGLYVRNSNHTYNYARTSKTDSNASFETTASETIIWRPHPEARYVALATTSFEVSFSAGTSGTITNTATVIYTNYFTNKTVTFTLTESVVYNASAETITISASIASTTTETGATTSGENTNNSASIIGNSTVSAIGNPTYIDCEIGEAYMIKNGDIVSCNQAVALGSDSPKLAPGANEITFDNTVTELKIRPRWWRV